MKPACRGVCGRLFAAAAVVLILVAAVPPALHAQSLSALDRDRARGMLDVI